MRTRYSDGIFDADYEFDVFFYYDVILTLHDALMTSFLLFLSISKTACVRIVGVTPNDAECMISYLSSIHYIVVSPSEKD